MQPFPKILPLGVDAVKGRFLPVSQYAKSVPTVKIIDFLFLHFAVV